MELDPNPPGFPAAWASAWGEDAYGLWQAFEINGVRQAMRWIEPGSFNMGSPENEPGHFDDEILHKVVLSRGYWLAESTCTQALWRIVTGKNPSHFKGNDQLPVEQVSWDDCQEFIEQAKVLLEGQLMLRLPTEAEWEYACRAGTQTMFSFGDKADLDLSRANYSGKWDNYGSGGKTVVVDRFPPNPWGLYQMHGNVYEWCADWMNDYSSEAVVDPTGSRGGRIRVLRGGGWSNRGRHLRSARRYAFPPDYRDYHIGLRLAGG